LAERRPRRLDVGVTLATWAASICSSSSADITPPAMPAPVTSVGSLASTTVTKTTRASGDSNASPAVTACNEASEPSIATKIVWGAISPTYARHWARAISRRGQVRPA